MLVAVFPSHSQVIAGIRANGKIMLHADTINVCKGSSINYLSAAQGSLNIYWRFNSATPSTAFGIGPFSVTYDSLGYDTTFQKVVGGAFSDSTFIIVHVSDIYPTAGYTFSPDNVCGNVPIQFVNTSTTGGPFSFLWSFADGAVSATPNVSHQFLSAVGMPGTQVFPVKLLATNVYGCKDSITRDITVRRVPDASIGNADALVSYGLFNGISTFKKCNNIPYYNFKFNNQSSTIANNTSYTIQWGEGSPDSTFSSWPAGQVITHNFPLGSSTMTVNVTGPDGCIGIRKYIVFLGTIPAGGLASLGNTDICSSDSLRFLITNIDNNPPGTTYSFLINDGSGPQMFQHVPPTTVAHHFEVGSCLFSSNNGINTYINSFGAYLTIENPCGSNSASVVPIYVSGKPRPAIYLPTPVVCVNSIVNISNASNFGNVINPTGTFTSECLNNGTKVWAISPSSGFNLISGSLGSLNGDPSNGGAWTDGSNSLTVQFTATGTYSIKIYIFNDRCGIDSTIRTICVRNPPQASFTMNQHSSCDPATIDFINTSPPGGCQADDYNWTITYSDPEGCAPPNGNTYSFVNGSSAISGSPSVLFSKVGKYVIRLTVKAVNSPYGCPEEYAMDSFYVKGPPKASILPISSICANNNITPITSIVNCYAPGPYGYRWSFTGGSPASSNAPLPGNIFYSSVGTYPIQLIVTDSSCGLSDTTSIALSVTSPPLAEAGADASVCSGTPVQLGMNGVAGITYQWTPALGLSNPSLWDPIAILNYSGVASDTVYTYYLSASAGISCNSTDSVKITVRRKPAVIVDPVTSQICIGSSVPLTASGADVYAWSPSATLNNFTTATVIATPSATTSYMVVGTLLNGCSDTKTSTITVHPNAHAAFVAPDSVSCAPANINTLITNIAFPEGNGVYTWYADNILITSGNSIAVPSYIINLPGDTVTIKLVTPSPYGCKADSIQRPFITRPAVTAAFTKDRDSSCAPLNVLFTNTSSLLTGVQFFWNFGNGVTTTAVQPGTVTFNTSPAFRDTVYRIVLKEYNGCDTTYFRDSVKVFANSKARFAVDTTRGCSPFIIHIQNTSLGNNFIYYWDFGDGQTDTTHVLTSFTHTYYTGIIRNYTIRLISENRCTRDTQSIIIVVNPISIQPFISAYGNQLSGCAPHLVTFNNSSVGAAQLTCVWRQYPPVIIPNNQNSVRIIFFPGNYTWWCACKMIVLIRRFSAQSLSMIRQLRTSLWRFKGVQRQAVVVTNTQQSQFL
jgi:PKD repeat protein